MATSLVDLPSLKNPDEDQLNMVAYSNALAKFINGAQTPLTIALQGEWGSGKTSLMNALSRELCGEDGNFLRVEINTWQYSLLANPMQSILSIVSGMMEQIKVKDDGRKSTASRDWDQTVKMYRQIAAVAMGNLAGKLVGIGEMGSEARKAIDSYKKGAKSDDAENLFEAVPNPVEGLKDGLRKRIERSLRENPGRRGYIFFIDDLDRIDPAVAVQILELLKNVFDLDKCIFVLAIDYSVVVKGLRSKFGEMTVSNQREFRSFFDKIIQLPFAMPVGSYCIDSFLMRSLLAVEYINRNDVGDSELCKTLSQYAHDSVGTNPRSLKRLMNSLSLVRILVEETATNDDDFDFAEWKDVVFALECIKIQYPLVHDALRRFGDFSNWGPGLAQAFELDELTEDEKFKLKKLPEDFGEEWKQMLYALCKKDPFLLSRAMNISQMLNRIKTRIEGKKESVEEIVGALLNLSAVTDVKSDYSALFNPDEIDGAGILKALRGSTFGMELMHAEDETPYYAGWITDEVAAVSWPKRVERNLLIDFVNSRDKAHPYKGDCTLKTKFQVDFEEGKLGLYMTGNFYGYMKDGKQRLNLTNPKARSQIMKVEQTFKNAWRELNTTGYIFPYEDNFQFNVFIPISGDEMFSDEIFGRRLKGALKRVFDAFVALKPFC